VHTRDVRSERRVRDRDGTSFGCTRAPAAAGTPCSLGLCSTGDACNAAGDCVVGLPVAVDDGNPCTIDGCDPVLGVQHDPAAAGTVCDNATVCDGREICNGAGACTSGTPPAISDNNPCTDDACDAIAGITHTPRAAGDPICSNLNACDGLETCSSTAVCQAGTAPAIDDQNVCTIDACAPAIGVTHTAIPGCDPTPFQGAAPFETRASILGKLTGERRRRGGGGLLCHHERAGGGRSAKRSARRRRGVERFGRLVSRAAHESRSSARRRSTCWCGSRRARICLCTATRGFIRATRWIWATCDSSRGIRR